MTLAYQKKFVDTLFYKAIRWLSSEQLYNDAHNGDILDTCCLSTACDIVTLTTSAMSPKHFGLTIHLHHDFGSRKLIEDIHALGHCVSYAELRCFLNSVAIHVSAAQNVTKAGATIPPDIVPKDRGGQQLPLQDTAGITRRELWMDTGQHMPWLVF